MSHWRRRIGDRLEVLLAGSLRVAHKAGALKTDDLARVSVDTTVQPKNVTHAPETECIGKGKARAPYEFGVKVSIVTTNRRAKGGQFVLHARALPGNPYDGHTLADVLAGTETLTGRTIQRAYADKGYRGHDAPGPLRVFLSGQKRGVHGAIKRELRRRPAIEPVIGHMKSEGQLSRNYLKGRSGDQTNAVLSATGYNFRLILKWLKILWRLIRRSILGATDPQSALNPAS